MIVTGIGWFLTLHRIYPSFTALADVKDFIPDPFAYAFVGAFLASVFIIFEYYRLYNLEPDVYYSTTYRILFSTVAAYTIGRIFDSAYTPLAAFGIGLFPIQTTWDFITEKTAQKVGATRPEGEFGLELAKIQGLEHQRNRQELIDANVSTIQALATSDPMLLFFNTTSPLRTIIDLIDKALLYSYLGDKVTELRKHGINGVIELVAIAQLADKSPAFENQNNKAEPEIINAIFRDIDVNKLISNLASVVGQTTDELKAFIYNLYYDPLGSFIYDIWGRCLNLDHRLDIDDEMEMNGEPNLNDDFWRTEYSSIP